jgi:lipoic acid synthetase
MGFLYAASAPLVRSSYKAAEVFVRSLLGRSGHAASPAGGGPAGAPGVEALLEERLAHARREAARIDAALAASGEDQPGLPAPAPAAAQQLVPVASLVRR